MKQQRLKHYEYPIKHPNGTVYMGSYTIKDGVKPKGYKGEKLVQKFYAPVLEPGEVHFTKEETILNYLEKFGLKDAKVKWGKEFEHTPEEK